MGILLSACATSGTVYETREVASPQRPAHNGERKLYFAKDSSEAEMSYSFYVLAGGMRPTPEQAEALVEKQVAHLFGTMTQSFSFTAIPKRGHQISNVSVRPAAGGWRIDYDYRGIIVAQEAAGTTQIPILLPFDPTRIFAQGNKNGQLRPNPCTDPHYDLDTYHWYFWNPRNPGCGLKEGEHYARIEAKLKRLPNSRAKYPQYRDLVHNGEIRVDVLMGLDNPWGGVYDPVRSRDYNATNWRAIAARLRQAGYKSRVWDRVEVERYGQPTVMERGLPWVEEFTKQAKNAKITVRVVFGNSELDSGRVFQAFLKDALETASVFVYAGHSGLGANLDLDKIERLNKFKIEMPKDRYQIHFMNGCSTYSYYNSMFFKRKESPADPRGTKNLDIITNGLATYFTAIDPSTNTLLSAIDAWGSSGRSMSYPQMIQLMDSDNLIGINGEEDNPDRPL